MKKTLSDAIHVWLVLNKAVQAIASDATRNVMVGMTLVGPSVGELIQAATISIVGAVPLER